MFFAFIYKCGCPYIRESWQSMKMYHVHGRLFGLRGCLVLWTWKLMVPLKPWLHTGRCSLQIAGSHSWPSIWRLLIMLMARLIGWRSQGVSVTIVPHTSTLYSVQSNIALSWWLGRLVYTCPSSSCSSLQHIQAMILHTASPAWCYTGLINAALIGQISASQNQLFKEWL